MEKLSSDRLRLSVNGRKALHNICVEKYKEEHGDSIPSKSGLRTWIIEKHSALKYKNGSLGDSSLKKLLNHVNMGGNLVEGTRTCISHPYSSNIDDLARSIGYTNTNELKTKLNKDLKNELCRIDFPKTQLLKEHLIEIHFTSNEILLLAYESRNRYKIVESNIESLCKNYIVMSNKIKLNETFQIDQLLNEDDDIIDDKLRFNQIIEIKLVLPK